jgi:SAM-dependent methyltransferase
LDGRDEPEDRMTPPEASHWEAVWSRPPRMRLPRAWLVPISDRIRLVRGDLQPGTRFLEIGCAPGKFLAHVSVKFGVQAAGLDSSERGIAWARLLFASLGVAADLRQEDVFATTFEAGRFDVVHSAGLIEHFEDPIPIIEAHLRLLRPGGVAIVTAPNFGGLYGLLARTFAPRNLGLHHAAATCHSGLVELSGRFPSAKCSVKGFGRLSVSAVQFEETIGRRLARTIDILGNVLGLVQFIEIAALCPQLVLRMVKAC